MEKEALLIIDMLNDFVLTGAPLEVPQTRTIIKKIQREIKHARSEKKPVMYLCDTHEPDDKEFRKFNWPAHAVKGTKGSEIIRELAPLPGDIVIPKNTYSGFYNTTLEEDLKRLRITRVRLTGCVTHICVLFTAADAALRDYDVTVVKDAVAGTTKEDHDAALRIMKNVLGAEII